MRVESNLHLLARTHKCWYLDGERHPKIELRSSAVDKWNDKRCRDQRVPKQMQTGIQTGGRTAGLDEHADSAL